MHTVATNSFDFTTFASLRARELGYRLPTQDVVHSLVVQSKLAHQQLLRHHTGCVVSPCMCARPRVCSLSCNLSPVWVFGVGLGCLGRLLCCHIFGQTKSEMMIEIEPVFRDDG